MGRHAADVLARLNIRVPRGNQAYWEIIRELRRFTITDIEQRCNVDRRVIGDYVRRLAKAGVVITDGKTGDAVVYRLVADQPDAPAVRRDGTLTTPPGLGQERMWRSMKMLKTFDAAELAAAASIDDVPVSLETAKNYITHLLRVGYSITAGTARAPAHGAAGSRGNWISGRCSPGRRCSASGGSRRRR
ncbi:conserved hypothetical protein [uncultured Alphaproteobacteria bacterium]|uniref:Uncharacterized protein n=1 Tax=uncultured Alphaproteobacteria bacterium TaxID=91750 RepID=A0A212KN22_9PROT|nr:conserved hypothetical protein [uncultured Alphaproteobacteria bacterium]